MNDSKITWSLIDSTTCTQVPMCSAPKGKTSADLSSNCFCFLTASTSICYCLHANFTAKSVRGLFCTAAWYGELSDLFVDKVQWPRQPFGAALLKRLCLWDRLMQHTWHMCAKCNCAFILAKPFVQVWVQYLCTCNPSEPDLAHVLLIRSDANPYEEQTHFRLRQTLCSQTKVQPHLPSSYIHLIWIALLFYRITLNYYFFSRYGFLHADLLSGFYSGEVAAAFGHTLPYLDGHGPPSATRSKRLASAAH